MSRPNTLLALVTTVLVALLGLAVWALLDRDRAIDEVLPVQLVDAGPARTSISETNQTAHLQDPSTSIEPAAAVQRPERNANEKSAEVVVQQASEDVLRFLQRILPERYGALTAAEAAALTTLDLRGAQITDDDLAQLAALPALESVSLRGTAITDAGLGHLRSVPKLTAVDLRGTKVTGVGISALPTHRIEALHLTDTQVSADDLRSLPAMPNLHVFKLNRLKVGDDALAQLDYLPSLQHLEMDGTSITDDGVRGLLARNPNIRRIELRETSVTEEAILEFAQAYPGVELVKN